MTTTELAEQVCQLILKRFPDLEIQHDSPEDFFDGYYDYPGFPHNDNFTPVWFQKGRLITWQTPNAYYWDPEALNFDATTADDDETRINFLFLQDDGSLATVDDYEGETHRLMPTPEADTLAHFIQLFFQAGREQLSLGTNGVVPLFL